MADAASISITATMLPDEIAKTFTGSMTVTPVANELWYYKLTSITVTSTNLIAGSYVNYTAIAVGTGHTPVATGDTIRFLFVQNTGSVEGIYLSFDGAAAVHSGVDNVFIGPGETWFGRLPNTTVGNLKAISSLIGGTGSDPVAAIVIALIDDDSA